MEKGLSIGALARSEGVGVETIRFYQRLGLMDAPPRPARGARRYGAADAERLRFIRRAKAMGFTLAQIEALIRMRRRPVCQESRALATERLAAIETRLAELGALRGELEAWVAQCDANASENVCPPLAALG